MREMREQIESSYNSANADGVAPRSFSTRTRPPRAATGHNIAIGLLAGVLNGAAFGRSVVDQNADLASPANTGQAMLVMRSDLFRLHRPPLSLPRRRVPSPGCWRRCARKWNTRS